jgi:hypothetical protein
VRLLILASLDNLRLISVRGQHGTEAAAVCTRSSLSRHCDRQKTFFNDGDYQAYIARLVRYRMQFGVTIYAYCLTSNHFLC